MTKISDVLTSTEIVNDPEWVRPPKPGQTVEGCARSFLYELIKERKIRSVALRAREKQRGIRLIHLPSLRRFIADSK
jgi:hypothetical protein